MRAAGRDLLSTHYVRQAPAGALLTLPSAWPSPPPHALSALPSVT